ncbi:unnamed protein product [Vicia faba]|uniref:Secreted protein n=1 Tax=Vicia faba TaxID=3906 RepID=A0AAV0Z3D7_VICFA|nr:unnamed protein product [Vicia faba]
MLFSSGVTALIFHISFNALAFNVAAPLRAAYIKKIPRCDISKQLRNKIIGHSLKNLSNEEINMKKWWLSRLRRVSLVIGGLLRDLHCNPVLELRLLAVLFRGYRSGCGYVVKVTFAVFGC